MQGTLLTPAETAFFNSHKQAIDTVIADLTTLAQQLQTSISSFFSQQDNILARIRQLVPFSQDIEQDIRQVSQQTSYFLHRGMSAPIVDFEGEPIPVILNNTERGKYNGTLTSIDLLSTEYSLVDPQQAMRSMSGPLTKFLATRSTSPTSTATASVVPNVTVSNTTSGWQIVYSPTYASVEYGLGGPSTPVSGYISPGRYRFGIKKTAPAQWDSTSWKIPRDPTPHVPLP